MKTERGFTLIELLVVISIIAILSAVGMVAYGSVNKGARDAKRKSDMKFIQSALEGYNSDKTYYPFLLTILTADSKKYLTEVPKDPTTNSDYLYKPSGTDCAQATPENCKSYCIYTKLEMTNSFTGDSSCSEGAGTNNYGVTRP